MPALPQSTHSLSPAITEIINTSILLDNKAGDALARIAIFTRLSKLSAWETIVEREMHVEHPTDYSQGVYRAGVLDSPSPLNCSE
jgi:hypothetical protein